MNLTFSLHTGVRIFVGAIFILSSIGKFIDSSDAQYLVELLSMNIYWLIGLSLATQAPHLYKALVHSICFGSKMIVDRFENEGIKIESVIGVGGVARKSPYIMQTLANVLNMPIKITASDQTPALGAAIYASVVGMIHKDVKTAIEIMGSEFETEYYPQADLVEKNKTYYQQYKNLAQFAEANTKSSSS